jgi:hypothetical protein
VLFSSPQSPFSGKRAAEAGYDLTGLKEVKKYPCIFFLTACGKKKLEARYYLVYIGSSG